jgi:DNA-binding NtrC family response regulator
MRWHVLPASGGAEAMVHLGEAAPEAMIVDHWLPDLDAAEFTDYASAMCPGTDMLQMDGSSSATGGRSARRNELLHALREAQEEGLGEVVSHQPQPAPRGDGPSWLLPDSPGDTVTDAAAAAIAPTVMPKQVEAAEPVVIPTPAVRPADVPLHLVSNGNRIERRGPTKPPLVFSEMRMHLPEMVGDAPQMREMARLVRMVAPHTANMLILGETGTGKELVAKAVHRLSHRAGKPFVVLNCAAIPEQLLEAELFGHTRGAFTGAVTSRTGRIEAAHGGTLFLDEIGEMPLPLQAKMLRFLENGEIQKVGENESLKVDVRIVAATHQPLEQNAAEHRFRSDLYFRLAVFPVDVPTLRSRLVDIPMLAEHFLRKFGEAAPRKTITPEAVSALMDYHWPGNVRELGHMLQRAAILCGDGAILPEHIRLRDRRRAASLSAG